jgi:hypothetical protein
MRTLLMLLALTLLGSALAGCRASVGIGDTATNLTLPR